MARRGFINYRFLDGHTVVFDQIGQNLVKHVPFCAIDQMSPPKSMRRVAQIARFWLLRRRVSQSLHAHSQTRKHWGREYLGMRM